MAMVGSKSEIQIRIAHPQLYFGSQLLILSKCIYVWNIHGNELVAP
jgi:hypothetical protein